MSAKAYASYFQYSSSVASAWLRKSHPSLPPLVTAIRAVRDVDEDSVRSVQEQFVISAGDGPGNDGQLSMLSSFPTAKPDIIDISPSGKKTFSATNKDDVPLLQVTDHVSTSFKVDASEEHGKVVGDAWFGGVSWSADDRFVAYVAAIKAEKRGKFFSSELSEAAQGRKFEDQEDWGEKYVGVSKLSICVLDTVTGKGA
jgi:hypothetical protein